MAEAICRSCLYFGLQVVLGCTLQHACTGNKYNLKVEYVYHWLPYSGCYRAHISGDKRGINGWWCKWNSVIFQQATISLLYIVKYIDFDRADVGQTILEKKVWNLMSCWFHATFFSNYLVITFLILLTLMLEVLIQTGVHYSCWGVCYFPGEVQGILPPDSRTGFRWALWSSPAGPEDLAPTAQSVGSCEEAAGHRTWLSAALPPGGLARSPRPWPEPGQQKGGGEKERAERGMRSQ